MSRTTETWHWLFIAVLTLAAGPETLPERLARAYEAGLRRLFAGEDWPPSVQSEVAALRAELNRIFPVNLTMSASAIRSAVADADAQLVRDIARRTVLLYRKLVEGDA